MPRARFDLLLGFAAREAIERNLLPYCQEHQITIIAYTPLDHGRLATPSAHSHSMRVLEQVAAEVQKSPAQVALNWLTAHPQVQQLCPHLGELWGLGLAPLAGSEAAP